MDHLGLDREVLGVEAQEDQIVVLQQQGKMEHQENMPQEVVAVVVVDMLEQIPLVDMVVQVL
jgi:hypothetical protein